MARGAVLLILFAGACEAPTRCEVDEQCPAQLVCGDEGVCGAPGTRFFAISQLGIPGTDGMTARGFDLDGITSTGEGTGCVERARDYTSADDPSVTGVDNVIARFVDELGRDTPCTDGLSPEDCIAERMTSHISTGSTLRVIELDGLESWRTDSEVEVVVHGASVPGCPPGAQCAPELEGRTLAAGQRFDLVEPNVATGTGAIDDGILTVALAGAFTVELDQHFLLRDPSVAARVDADGLHDILVGGGVAYADLCIEGFCESDSIEEADLDPDPRDPTRCRRVSMTFSAAAVPAYDQSSF
jgi:hypothetical protein